MLLAGRQEGHPACKKREWWGAGVVICLERGADLHMAQLMPLPLTVSCFSKIHIGFTFLVPAHPGSPGQRVVKWVCICVCDCWITKFTPKRIQQLHKWKNKIPRKSVHQRDRADDSTESSVNHSTSSVTKVSKHLQVITCQSTLLVLQQHTDYKHASTIFK